MAQASFLKSHFNPISPSVTSTSHIFFEIHLGTVDTALILLTNFSSCTYKFSNPPETNLSALIQRPHEQIILRSAHFQ